MTLAEDRTNWRGPVLFDGTRLADLIDYERREVSMRVLADPMIHEIEQRKVFAKSWFGLGHVNEIPDAGDFVLRFIGQNQVIVVRDREGAISVLLNACSHRGMEICWAEEGNQASFKCPYHGWVFDHSGALMGAPFEKEMYGDWDKTQYGLRRAKVEVRHGFIFGSLDPKAVELSEWMGDFGYYFDHGYKGSDDLIPIGAPQRFTMKANWKTIADQNAGDLYHIAGSHKAVVELGYMPNIVDNLDVVKVGFPPLGHNVFGLNPMHTAADGTRFVDQDLDRKYAFENRNFNIYMFPITTGHGVRYTELPDGTRLASTSLNTYMPKGSDSFEVWQLHMIDRRTPEAMRKAMTARFAISNSMLQDDADSVQSIQSSTKGSVAQDTMMKYNAVLGEQKPKDWPGPGVVHAGFSRDDTQWDFWRRWFELMCAEPAA